MPDAPLPERGPTPKSASSEAADCASAPAAGSLTAGSLNAGSPATGSPNAGSPATGSPNAGSLHPGPPHADSLDAVSPNAGPLASSSGPGCSPKRLGRGPESAASRPITAGGGCPAADSASDSAADGRSGWNAGRAPVADQAESCRRAAPGTRRGMGGASSPSARSGANLGVLAAVTSCSVADRSGSSQSPWLSSASSVANRSAPESAVSIPLRPGEVAGVSLVITSSGSQTRAVRPPDAAGRSLTLTPCLAASLPTTKRPIRRETATSTTGGLSSRQLG